MYMKMNNKKYKNLQKVIVEERKVVSDVEVFFVGKNIENRLH